MVKKKKVSRGANGLPWLRRDRKQYYVTDLDTGKKRALLDRNGNIVRWDDELTEVENQNRANAVWFESQNLRRAGQNGDENEVRVVLELYGTCSCGRPARRLTRGSWTHHPLHTG
jgi:hypothetical protein